MKKLSTNEKAIAIAATLKNFGIVADIRKGKDGEQYIVQTPEYVFLMGVPKQPDGYMVHVLADAALAVLVLPEVFKIVPGLVSFGPYARDPDNGAFVTGEGAQEIKKSLIMAQAAMIARVRDEQADKVEETPEPTASETGLIAKPAESQIILSSRG